MSLLRAAIANRLKQIPNTPFSMLNSQKERSSKLATKIKALSLRERWSGFEALSIQTSLPRVGHPKSDLVRPLEVTEHSTTDVLSDSDSDSSQEQRTCFLCC